MESLAVRGVLCEQVKSFGIFNYEGGNTTDLPLINQLVNLCAGKIDILMMLFLTDAPAV